MLQLMLLRHAKSSWDDDCLDDAARALNARGRKAAAAMGRMMMERGFLPACALCSPAVRAAETWQLVSSEFGTTVPSRTLSGLYDFGDGSRLLDIIREHGGKTARLMLVGHNPAIGNAALRLVGAGEPYLRGRLKTKYPTAALAIIDVPIEDWRQLQEGTGQLAQFIRPRDLEA